MPKYRIVVEDTTTHLYAKTFEAPTFEAAQGLAESEEWNRFTPDRGIVAAESWEEFDEYVNAEIRDDLCSVVET